MSKLSDKARDALRGAIVKRGKHRGQLLSRCPPSYTLAAAAWQAAIVTCNPYKISIRTLLFMTTEQKEVFEEVRASFEAMPFDYFVGYDRDREALEYLGVW